MNRAEARIRSYQNSISQLNPTKDSSKGNSGTLASLNHSKSFYDEMNLARKFGRKKKRRN